MILFGNSSEILRDFLGFGWDFSWILQDLSAIFWDFFGGWICHVFLGFSRIFIEFSGIFSGIFAAARIAASRSVDALQFPDFPRNSGTGKFGKWKVRNSQGFSGILWDFSEVFWCFC